MGRNQDKGNQYENFVELVYKALLGAEQNHPDIKNINIEKKKVITSADGTKAEIDLYWEYNIANITTHSIAIECKNHNRNIDIPKVRDFAAKISDISGLKGLMVTKYGFSAEAIKAAKAKNIDLLILRPMSDDDWEGRIKTICTNFHFSSPARIINISPKFDKEWAEANGYNEGAIISLNGYNNEIIIADDGQNFCKTIHQLEQDSFDEKNKIGKHIWTRNFSNGWIKTPENSFKITSIDIEYIQPSPIIHEDIIDFGDYVLGILEYVNGGIGKHVVLKSGEKRILD